MELSQPPIGNAAVRAFYTPVHLVEIRIPVGGRIVTTECHVKAAPNITAFFDLAHERGLTINSFDGIYNPRPKRMSNEPSMHAYGAAFDIDASSNNQGDEGGTMSAALVEIADSLGFFWGGLFRGPYVDKMHFQLGVDFPLDGRPVPAITYRAGAPAVAATTQVYHSVKSFNASTSAEIGADVTGAIIAADGHAYVKAVSLAALLGVPVSVVYRSGVFILRVGDEPTEYPLSS